MWLWLQSRFKAWSGDLSLRRLLKNTSFLFSAEALTALISLVQFPLVTRWLGLENYGLWGLASGWVGLVGQFFGFRLWETIIKYLNQFMAENDEERTLAILKLCVYVDITISVLIFAGLALTADIAASVVYKSYPGGADLIRLETLSGFMTLTSSIWLAVLRVFDRYKRVSVFNVVSALAQFGLWMLALKFNAGVGGLILAAATIKLGQTVALGLLAQRELGRRFTRHWRTANLNSLVAHRRAILTLLFSMSLDTFRKIVSNNLDVLIVGQFGNPFQVGIYKLAEQLTGYVSRILGRFYDTIYPEIPRLLTQEGPEAVRTFIRRVTFGLGAAMLLIILGVYAITPFVVPLVFGVEAAAALPVFFILVLSNFWVLLFWAPSLLVALGKAPQLVGINFAISSLTLLALLIFTPMGFAYGAALSSVVNLIAGLLIYMAYFSRIPGFEWQRIFLKV